MWPTHKGLLPHIALLQTCLHIFSCLTEELGTTVPPKSNESLCSLRAVHHATELKVSPPHQLALLV